MRILFTACLFLLTACAGTQQTDFPLPPTFSVAELEATINTIVEEEMEATHLPGVAVVIVQNGKTIIKRGYGVADVASGRLVDPDRTLFRIGSVTKALTGLAVTRLIDDGRVGLDDDVTKYFDKISNQTGSDEPVTVEHLITHTGGFDQIGIGRHVYDFDKPLDTRKAMRPSLADFLGDNNLRRVTPPGQLFRYDTYGISLAGLVLARATGLSYAEAMHQEMFKPLGMTRSFVEADYEHFNDLAIGHGWIDSAYVAQPYEIYMTTPASSIDATPADMGRLLEALTGNGATTAGGRLFSKEAAANIRAPQYRPHPKFTGITHSLWESPSVDPPDGPEVHSVGHGGSMLGFWTMMEIFTESKTGVFVVTNRNWEAGGGPVNLGGRINRAVIDALYEVPPKAQLAEAVDIGDRDLSEYAGAYVFGTFCKSCTQEEFAQGAWPVGNPRMVRTTEEGLLIDEALFFPTADPDVFVHQEGTQEIFFGRDKSDAVSYFTSSYGPSTFEREEAYTNLLNGISVAEEAAAAGDLTAAQKSLSITLQAALDAGLQNEGTINGLGYQYLQNQVIEMAILVFTFNVQSFPDSWNVHDSLGEALAVAQRYDEAIKAYERSLALNPDSETGKAALARLRMR